MLGDQHDYNKETLDLNSKSVARAALYMALSDGREEEQQLKERLWPKGLVWRR